MFNNNDKDQFETNQCGDNNLTENVEKIDNKEYGNIENINIESDNSNTECESIDNELNMISNDDNNEASGTNNDAANSCIESKNENNGYVDYLNYRKPNTQGDNLEVASDSNCEFDSSSSEAKSEISTNYISNYTADANAKEQVWQTNKGNKKKPEIKGILKTSFILVLAVACGFMGSMLNNKINKPNSSVVFQEVVKTINNTGSENNYLNVEEVAEKTKDSVVEIVSSTSSGGIFNQASSVSSGSGVILSSDGYIVTNNHVIEGATSITVKDSKGKSYSAKLIGRDAKTDLAVVKIDANGLTVAVFASADSLKVGAGVVAIGNPLGTYGGSVTDGIVSALSRSINIDGYTMNLMQISAPVNPGNSGGGLFNMNGELIGIVNAKSKEAGVEGIGFAIPIATVKSVSSDLIVSGFVTGRVELGVTLIDINNESALNAYNFKNLGVYVLKVTNAGLPLASGDRIISINNTAISSATDVKNILGNHKIGDTLKFSIERGGSVIEVSYKLTELKN